ncbi:MAG: hypothetical protein ACT4OI_04435, partial [Methanobacteriota archaeon]
MARRKRKDEEPGWAAPEFDEVEFMRKEISSARMAVFVVAWAVVGALFSFGATVVGLHPLGAFLIGLFMFGGLYFVFPLVGVSVETFKRRDWFGQGGTYFFSWLAFWILLLNQPIADFTAPTIHGITVGVYDPSLNPAPDPASVLCTAVAAWTVTITRGSNSGLFVLFRATDNVGVARDDLRVSVNSMVITSSSIEEVEGTPHACSSVPGQAYAAGSFVVKVPLTAQPSYAVDITASDAGGRSHRVTF